MQKYFISYYAGIMLNAFSDYAQNYAGILGWSLVGVYNIWVVH